MKKFLSVFLTFIFFLPITYTLSPVCSAAVSAPDITAPAAILIEQSSGKILYAKNENDIRPCASITKIMTLLLVMEELENGNLNLDDMLTASEHAASMGGSDIWLKAGEQMSVNDLIKATCVASANDAAVVLAEAICGSEDAFVDEMNKKAQKLGMTNTTFKNCNGLDQDGHLTCAADIAIMSRELLKYDKILEYTSIRLDYLRDGKTQLVNTNKLLNNYPGITGLKTGTTSQAGSCMSASAQKNDLHLIAVVLGCQNSTDRFNDSKLLLDYGFSNFLIYTPNIENDVISSVNIENGMKNELLVVYDKPNNIVVSKQDKSKISSSQHIFENISAPVHQGDKIGYVQFLLNGEVLNEISILASEDIEEITFKSILKLFLENFFII
ncbi:MAG: D-alanyl-D-alanine carboxypeptidase family protein [Clostridia bacterium]|nr:D-alanyl-D-alanine carboxypeptidase family protein [Clostridia bacterium]